MPYCPNCGTQNAEAAKFCTSCGTSLQNLTADRSTTPPPLVTPSLNIGTRVSFTTADGRSYTGTVMEVSGDQYKIKYDGYNFEAWLQKNQLSVIAATSTIAQNYSGAMQNVNPQTLSAGPSSSPGFLTHIGFWASTVIIIGFFVNWIGYGFGYGYSGLNYLTFSIQSFGSGGDQEWRLIVISGCMLLIIISALLCLLHSFGAVGKSVFSIFKTLPLFAFAGWVALILSDSDTYYDPGDLIQLFGVGAYMTLAGSIVLVISGRRRR